MHDRDHVREQVDDLLDQHAQWADIRRTIERSNLTPGAKNELWLHAWYRITRPQRAMIVRRHSTQNLVSRKLRSF